PLFEPESLPESWPAELSASEPVESEELSESASFADSEEPPDSESEPEFDWLPSEPESEPCDDELDEPDDPESESAFDPESLPRPGSDMESQPVSSGASIEQP